MMKKLLLWSITILCISQIGLATNKNTIIPPVYLRNNVVDSIYLPDIIHDDDYDDYSIKDNVYLQMRYDKMTRMIYVKPSIEETGLTAMSIQKGDHSFDVPVIIKRTTRYTFTVLPKSDNPKAYLAGTFNNWSPTTLPMIPDQNGIPHLTMYLEPGRYFYKYLLDGEIVTDANLPVLPDGRGGEMNMLTIVPSISSVLLQPLHHTKNTDGSLTLSFIVNGITSLQTDNIIAFRNNTLFPKDRIRIEKNRFFLTFSQGKNTKDNEVIRLGVHSGSGSTSLYTVVVQDGKIVNKSNNGNEITNEKTIYSVLIDRFHDGSAANNETKIPDSVIPFARYKGGDFAGITKKIKDGYFSSLNITTLLLSPVADNPDTPFLTTLTAPSKSTAYLGLWPVHHEKVENHFGTMEELQTLIDEAHKRGISVILDYIADQVHKDHPYVKSHPEWFVPYRGGDTFVKVIDFNSHPEAIEAVTDNIIWWIENTKADGIKIDNAGTINEQFRRILARKIHSVEEEMNKDILVMGHIRDIPYLTPTIISQGQMSSVLNSHLYESLYASTLEKGNFDDLAISLSSDKICDYCLNYLDEPTGYYHPKIPAKRTLDFIPLPTAHQVDSMTTLKRKFKSLPLYHLLTHTLPGIPVIHTGEEVGFSATVSTVNPNTMFFGDSLFYEEKEVLMSIKKITSLRTSHPALRNGTFTLLFQQGNWIIYTRSDNTEKILIAVNVGQYEASLSCQIPEEYGAKQLIDLYASQPESILIKNKSTVQLEVPAWGFRIFSIQ